MFFFFLLKQNRLGLNILNRIFCRIVKNVLKSDFTIFCVFPASDCSYHLNWHHFNYYYIIFNIIFIATALVTDNS